MKKSIRNLMIATGVIAAGAVIVKKTMDKKQKQQAKVVAPEEEKEEYYDWKDIPQTVIHNSVKQKTL